MSDTSSHTDENGENLSSMFANPDVGSDINISADDDSDGDALREKVFSIGDLSCIQKTSSIFANSVQTAQPLRLLVPQR